MAIASPSGCAAADFSIACPDSRSSCRRRPGAWQQGILADRRTTRFLWDGDDRQLWYDRDGDDPSRAILIATILGISPALFSIEVI